MTERLIRFATYEPCFITRAEYDQIKRDVEARHVAQCSEVGDRVLARLLLDHEYRANELTEVPSANV